ncbi:MAG TPA: fibronectin type III domain-containing protein, partial [Nocardioides sp.]|nr:fibronectin type III domain-containing protein [Nocardioides sp.]
DWRLAAQHVTGTSYALTGLPGWHRVQVQVAPIKGSWRAEHDAWSNVVDLDVPGDHLDPPAPIVSATAAGVATVRWAVVPGATSYAVQWRRLDQPEAWQGPVVTPGLSASVAGLTSRGRYVFRVQAARPAMSSAWSADAGAVVPPPRAVRSVLVRPTGHGVRTSAAPVAEAASYTLRVATARGCGRVPRDGRFEVAADGLTRTSKKLRLDAVAVWVRWVAVRDGIEGAVAPSSSACTRLPR